MLRFSIEGAQAAQQANQRAIAAVSPRGGLGRAVKYVLTAAHRYETSIIHVDTGGLRSNQRMDLQGARGVIYTDPTGLNPRTHRRVVEYAAVEHNRGYPHNYAQRTVQERGQQLGNEALQGMIEEMR